MDLADALALARRYARSIAVVLILVTAASLAGLMMQRPVYNSAATLFFTVKTEGAAGQLREAMDYASSQAKTYSQLAQTPTILDPAGATLTPQLSGVQLADHLHVSLNEDTAQLTLLTDASSAQGAADMANAIAQEIAHSVTVYSAHGAGGVLEAQIVRPGHVPAEPSSPNLLRNLGIALALGVAFGVAQALIRWPLESRVATTADVARAVDVPVVGELPFDRALGRGGDLLTHDSFAPRVEALRRLRTNMQFLAAANAKAPWLVTSSLPGEGKTATAIGIAKSFADSGARVVLVDADLRRPQVAAALGLEGAAGLTTALAGTAGLPDLIQSTHGIDVLCSGEIPPNPTELLGSDHMARLLSALSGGYDLVVVDSPPVLPVADAAVLSGHAGPVLVVASSGTVKRGQLQKTLKSLRGVDANVQGIVLNKIKTSDGEGYGYKYSYRYQPTGKTSKPNTPAALGIPA